MPETYRLDPDHVHESLAFLIEHDQSGRVFQSTSHQYLLQPQAKEHEVVEFEKSRSIHLPPEYRRFLTDIGNGGAGPYYGVRGLNELEEPSIDDYDDPSKPFPYTESWNGRPGEMKAIDAARAAGDEERYGDLVDDYWHHATRNGSLTICDFGCNLRFLLIVNGQEYGHIWFDQIADIKGYHPVNFDLSNRSGGYHTWESTDRRLQGLRRVNFDEWYGCWLEWACRHIRETS